MGGRLSGLEDDDRDDPVGVALVVRVVAVARDQPRPVGLALGVGRPPRADPAALAALELYVGLRGGDEVVEPRRVLVRAALGGDDDELVAVGQVEHGRDAPLPALAAHVVQQEDRQLLQPAADAALGRAEDRDVDPGSGVEDLPEAGGGGRRLHAPDFMVSRRAWGSRDAIRGRCCSARVRWWWGRGYRRGWGS